MLLILPIRTESEIRRTPLANYVLITLNFLLYFAFDEQFAGPQMAALSDEYLTFHSDAPRFHEFLTYQFVHASAMHVLGNLIFLWVFGNSVNSKMGNWAYTLFYLAGGVFAAWGYAALKQESFHLVGASGAIAAITTAYLALFPRSKVTVLIWLIFIHMVNVSAMIVIGLKIIVWDNIVGPMLSGPGDMVAYQAHLSGYLFGFVAAMAMLLMRALPRDQFDMLALWKRWNQRREFASAMATPGAAQRAQFGAVARTAAVDPARQKAEDQRLDRISDLRTEIAAALERGQRAEAASLFERLFADDPKQCLPERQQLEVGREFYQTDRHRQAAAAFERLLECYPRSTEASEVGLLLGIIYARDLRQYDMADRHLTSVCRTLRDENRRSQAMQWLADVRAALGKPAPEPSTDAQQ